MVIMSAITGAIGPFNNASRDVQAVIFSYLNVRDLSTCTQLNTKLFWDLAGAFNLLWKPAVCREMTFVGRQDFKEILKVDIGDDILFSNELILELLKPDLGGYVVETHMVITMSPSFVKEGETEEVLSSNSYGKLIPTKFGKQEGEDGYAYFEPSGRQEHGDKGIGEGKHLLLIKMDQVLPGSIWNSYEDKEKVLAVYNQKIQATTEISEALPTIIAFTMKLFKTSIFPSFWVCCKEMSGAYHLAVGGSASGGPVVDVSSDFSCGVLPSRKFFPVLGP